MSIDPTLARTLAAVAEEGTLDRGAARLGLTPSAVSQRLAALERGLGQRALVRTTPVALTEAGRVVVDFARRVDLSELEASAALGLSSESSPRIAVAVPSDALAIWFLEALALFTSRHAVQVEILRQDQDATAELLASGRVMAAISSRERPLPGSAVTRSAARSTRPSPPPPGGGGGSATRVTPIPRRSRPRRWPVPRASTSTGTTSCRPSGCALSGWTPPARPAI